VRANLFLNVAAFYCIQVFWNYHQIIGETMSLLKISLFSLLFAATASLNPAFEAMPQEGQQAPDFTLPSQDGTPVSLKDFRGKWVVLYFYPKDMTPGCTIEAHNFQRDIAKYEQANAVVLGVSVDTSGSHKEFCAQQGLTFKLLADSDKKVVDEYGSTMTYNGNTLAARNTFLIDPQGVIKKAWVKVDPKAHSEDVLAALKSFEAKGA
jgi:peroxiredoxin Q/BCP